MKLSRAQWIRSAASLVCLGPQLLAATPRLRVKLISGEEEYGSLVTLPALTDHLNQLEGLQASFERMSGVEPSLPLSGQEDLLVVFIRRRTPGPAFLESLRSHLKAGRPLVALRTSSHAFEDWKTFDAEVLGCHYDGHHGNEKHPIVHSNLDHPLTQDLKDDFPTLSSLYKVKPLAGDAQVFWTAGFNEGMTEPVGWTRVLPEGSRVVHLTLGHPMDFTLAPFMTVLTRACLWALNRPFASLKTPGLESFPVPEVDTETFARLARHHRTLALDVRTAREFAEGHVPGATLMDLSAGDFDNRARELDPYRPVVVYCHSGVRANRAVARLQKAGLKFVSVYPGSMKVWLQEGRKVEKLN